MRFACELYCCVVTFKEFEVLKRVSYTARLFGITLYTVEVVRTSDASDEIATEIRPGLGMDFISKTEIKRLQPRISVLLMTRIATSRIIDD